MKNIYSILKIKTVLSLLYGVPMERIFMINHNYTHFVPTGQEKGFQLIVP